MQPSLSGMVIDTESRTLELEKYLGIDIDSMPILETLFSGLVFTCCFVGLLLCCFCCFVE